MASASVRGHSLIQNRQRLMREVVNHAKEHCGNAHADSDEQWLPIQGLGCQHHCEGTEENYRSDTSQDHSSASMVPHGGVRGPVE